MLISDSPIKTMKDDLLNRKEFSKNLADAIIAHNSKEALAIGINGKWGSGKTSVLNMVIESIDSRKEIKDQTLIIKFNPWLCSDITQLISQFFIQITSQIKSEKKRFTELYKLINDYAEVLSIIPYAGKVISTLVQKQTQNYLNKTEKNLQSIKTSIVDHLTKEDIKIVVTIDDIDRLSSGEICAVFQLIKSLADFPRTVYVLAMDQCVVVQALNEVQRGNGLEYLQKIIQVPFDLPAPNSEDIYKVFFSTLDSVFGRIDDNDWDSGLWNSVFNFGVKYYLTSIRDTVRLTNVLSLKYSLLKDEVNKIDLIAITCLQVFEPSAYAKLSLYKEILCDENIFTHRENEKTALQKNAYDDITSEVSERHKAHMSALLINLFPAMSQLKINSHSGYRYIDKPTLLTYRSIAHIKCFDRYFALTLKENEISRAEITNLLYAATESAMILELKRMNTNGRITRALEELQANIDNINDKLPQGRAATISSAIAKTWQFINENDEERVFLFPFEWRLLNLIDSLMSRLDIKKRHSSITEIFEEKSIALSTVVLILRHLEEQHNRFTDKQRHIEWTIVASEILPTLESVFVNRTITEIDSGAIFDNKQLYHIIWLAEQIDPYTFETRKQKLIVDDSSLAKLICALISIGTVTERITQRFWNVNIDSVKIYIAPDEAYKRLLCYTKTPQFAELSVDNKHRLAAFLITMERQEGNNIVNHDIVLELINKRLEKIYPDETSDVQIK